MYNMLIQNTEHSYTVVLRKYTNFVSFFFSWDKELVPGEINANLQSKISDANKCDKHSSKLVSKSLHIQCKMLFKNKHKQGSYEKKKSVKSSLVLLAE